jgi:hypothetical protein
MPKILYQEKFKMSCFRMKKTHMYRLLQKAFDETEESENDFSISPEIQKKIIKKIIEELEGYFDLED